MSTHTQREKLERMLATATGEERAQILALLAKFGRYEGAERRPAGEDAEKR